MSRKIKFRAKALKQDTWCYGSYFKHIKRQVSPIDDSLKNEDIEGSNDDLDMTPVDDDGPF